MTIGNIVILQLFPLEYLAGFDNLIQIDQCIKYVFLGARGKSQGK